MKVRIEIAEHDRDELAWLHQMQRKYYPGPNSIVHIGPVYVLEIHQRRVEVLKRDIDDAMGDPNFENFDQYEKRNENQPDLFVGSPSEPRCGGLMPTIAQTVYVDVDAEDVLEDMTVEELAAHIVTLPGWFEACCAAEHKMNGSRASSLNGDLRAVFEQLSLHRPVEDALRRIAWDYFGRSVA
jgi:hypothetical protein